MSEIDIDAAQKASARMDDQAIEAHRRRMAAQAATPARANCVECGEEIPEERREAYPGVERCTSCQAGIEEQQLWTGY